MQHLLFIGEVKFEGLSMISPANGEPSVCSMGELLSHEGDIMEIKHSHWRTSAFINLSQVTDWVIVEDSTI